jgi:hypothetical protein
MERGLTWNRRDDQFFQYPVCQLWATTAMGSNETDLPKAKE